MWLLVLNRSTQTADHRSTQIILYILRTCHRKGSFQMVWITATTLLTHFSHNCCILLWSRNSLHYFVYMQIKSSLRTVHSAIYHFLESVAFNLCNLFTHIAYRIVGWCVSTLETATICAVGTTCGKPHYKLNIITYL